LARAGPEQHPLQRGYSITHWDRTSTMLDSRIPAVANESGMVSTYTVPKSHTDFASVFPAAFTMICTLLFILPLNTLINVSRNPAVRYFSGPACWFLLIIPIIIIVVHVIHVRKGAPSKYAIILALVLPSLLLLIFANYQATSAANKGDKLFSTDCDTFAIKSELQSSWEAAYNVYMECLNQTAAGDSFSVPQLAQTFRIQDCTNYAPDMSGHQKAWAYLRNLEEKYQCSGWCYHAQQLWSTKHSKDGCAVTVSSVYKYYVRPHASQVTLMMLLTLLVTVVMLALFGEKIRAHGFDW